MEENKPKEAKVVSSTSKCYSAGRADVNLNHWFIDSGATSHMSNDKSSFKKLQAIKVADGRFVKTTSFGKVQAGGIILEDVSYVPDLENSLIFVNSLAKIGYKLNFNGEFCKIRKGSKLISKIKCKNGLYELKTSYAYIE